MVSKRPPRKLHHRLPLPQAGTERTSPFGSEVAQEMEFMIELLELKPAEVILDVAAGAGRHALELSRHGFKNVTAVDLSDQLLDIGGRCAEVLQLPVRFLKGDAREPIEKEAFDAAFILGRGAFGLMESDAENLSILEAAYAALKPGGRLALSAMNLLHLIRHREDLSGFDPKTHYLTTLEEVQVEGDVIEELPVTERYYVFPGLRRDLEQIGFRNVLGFGADAGRYSSRAVSADDPEILIRAVKPKV